MRLFISYRRDDSAGYAGRLSDQLATHFGREQVFRDVVSIEPGEDFVQAIERAVGSCDVLVAVVGRDWRGMPDPEGKRRLDDPADYVRLEVATALARGVRVIPALVEGASMPAERDLPESLESFARRNAIELRDATWDHDVARLIQAIGRRAGRLPTRWTRRGGVALTASAVVLVLVVGVGMSWFRSKSSPDGPPTVPRDPTAGPGPPGSPPPRPQPPTGGASVPLTIPPGARTIIFGVGGDHLVYEVLSARLESGGQSLALTVRMTNNGQYDANFWDNSFRLIVDGVPLAPIGGLNELVPGHSVKERPVVFPARPADRSQALQIRTSDKTASIRLGTLRPVSRASTDQGGEALTARTHPLNAAITLGTVAFRIATATFEPYSDRQVLSLAVRITNNDRYDVAMSDDWFRLLVNGLHQAPVSGLNELVEGHSAKDATVRFELPENASRLILRIILGGKTTDVRLD